MRDKVAVGQLLILSSIVLASCVPPPNRIASEARPAPKLTDRTIGEWENRYEGSDNLAGVLVQQFPDNSGEAPAWEGGHPAMILFVMWDGKVNQIGYDPSGNITANFWWNLDETEHDYSYIWNRLNYQAGSDPRFKHHRDPRLD